MIRPEESPDYGRRAPSCVRDLRRAGVDCVYPICLWETDALRHFMSEVRGPVNVARMPEGPPVAGLAALGVARVSWGPFLHWDTMTRFKEQLATLQE